MSSTEINPFVTFPHLAICFVLEITMVLTSCEPENVIYDCFTLIGNPLLTYCPNPSKTLATSVSCPPHPLRINFFAAPIFFHLLGNKYNTSTLCELTIVFPKFGAYFSLVFSTAVVDVNRNYFRAKSTLYSVLDRPAP